MLLILGHPEHRRVQGMIEAAARLSEPPPRVLSYERVLSDPALDWSSWLTPQTVLRIESPGEHAQVMSALLARGARDYPEQATYPQAAWGAPDEAAHAYGLIFHPRQRFLGFCGLLHELEQALTRHPVRLVMSQPQAIIAMFDKQVAGERFEAHGVPCPERLGPLGGDESLRELMRQRRIPRVFVKLRSSSSASGVVAYAMHGAREVALTSTRLARSSDGQLQLYNSLKMQRYERREDIRALFDALAAHGALVERWEPKAHAPSAPGQPSKTFDLRVVVIDGQASHVVMRTSAWPMTNLHLGNARGDHEAWIAQHGQDPWQRMLRCAEQAYSPFAAQSLYAGVDVMLSADHRRALAIEINAFGDLLPQVLVQGQDTYGAQLLAVRRRLSGACS